MPFSEENLKRIVFYEEHYEIVVDLPLANDAPIVVDDYGREGEQKCRFCGNSKPKVTFKKRAHAVPEFLQNRSLVSRNECDICNEFFAKEYEDHLAKWFGPMRTLCQMRGKRGIPKYKSGTFIAEKGVKGMELRVKPGPHIVNMEGLRPGTFKIPVPMETQAYIPLRAAQALVKSAISVLPRELLPECENTILWLSQKSRFDVGTFSVVYAFTPGINPHGNGRVIICRRRDPTEKLPLLWFVIGTTNFLFQIMIPLCRSDCWMKYGQRNSFEMPTFPALFTEEYEKQYGRTVWYQEDWSCDKPTVQNREASFHVDRVQPE